MVGIVDNIKRSDKTGIGDFAKMLVEKIYQFSGLCRRFGIGPEECTGHGHHDGCRRTVPLCIGYQETPLIIP